MAGLHVVIEGSIGSGKTTLTNGLLPFLKHYFTKAQIVPEPIQKWTSYGSQKDNILDKMYKNPKRNSFLFQVIASVTKVKELVEIGKDEKGIKLAERSLEAQSKVFIPHLSQDNMLTASEKEALIEMIDIMLLQPGVKPDLILYLQASPDAVMSRIKLRNRAEEKGITMEYLTKLHIHYENWLTDPLIQTPVIIIDAEDITKVKPENVVKQIVQFSEKKDNPLREDAN
jgi:deoxyadenosine/deoxycytidine kinase